MCFYGKPAPRCSLPGWSLSQGRKDSGTLVAAPARGGSRETPGEVPCRPLLGSRMLFPGANVRGSLGTDSVAGSSDGAATSRFSGNQLLLGRRAGKIPSATTQPRSSSYLPGPRPLQKSPIMKLSRFPFCSWGRPRSAPTVPLGPSPRPCVGCAAGALLAPGTGQVATSWSCRARESRATGRQGRQERQHGQGQTPDPNLWLLFSAEGRLRGLSPCRSCRAGRSHYHPSLHTAQPGLALSLPEFSPQRDLIS